MLGLSVPETYKNLLVIGVQRTGSSALAELLNTHPAIALGWEWSEHTAFRRKLRILNDGLRGNFRDLPAKSRAHIEASLGPGTQWLGFRRLFGASDKWLGHPRWSLKLAADRFAAHQRWLRAHPEVHLVHIVRNDHIGWLKSKYLARAMDSFIGNEYPDDLQVSIPLGEALARVKAKVWVDGQLAQLAASNPYIRVEHERFAQELPLLAANIVEFLGCNPADLDAAATRIRRQSTRSDADYITNYDELRDAIEALDSQ